MAAGLMFEIVNGMADCPACEGMKPANEEEAAFFAANCTPEACQRNRFDRLPHAALWRWWTELRTWMNSGIPTDHIMREWNIQETRAWITFRSTFARLECDKMRREVES